VVSLVFSAGISIEPSIPLIPVYFSVSPDKPSGCLSNPTYLDGREEYPFIPALDAQEPVIGIGYYGISWHDVPCICVIQTLLKKLVSKGHKYITNSIGTNYTVDDKDCSLYLSDAHFKSEREVYFIRIIIIITNMPKGASANH